MTSHPWKSDIVQMRGGLIRLDVRFFGDLNLGGSQESAPFSNWGFFLVARPGSDLDDFPQVSLIDSGFVAPAFVSFFFSHFATGNGDLAERCDADFAMVLFPIGGRINFSTGIWG